MGEKISGDLIKTDQKISGDLIKVLFLHRIIKTKTR